MTTEQTKERLCSLCRQKSCVDGDDIVLFGKWMINNDLTVHYYCLLLSTHLPQNGSDNAGILGFLLRDIRREIVAAEKRYCTYCNASYASIRCDTCKVYFHLICGYVNQCLFQFDGEFLSYCDACIPLDDLQKNLMETHVSSKEVRCAMCKQYMCAYHPTRWIHAQCCKNGFVHNLCMQKYALNAGYYLRCIWCKEESFRNMVKRQGIFVPDRDANWEREKGAYLDLYRGHRRCDMEQCNCPRGRQYVSTTKWSLIICDLCGSFGAHNPACIPGQENSKSKIHQFICDTCSMIESSICQVSTNNIDDKSKNYLIATSLYVQKDKGVHSENLLHETPEFSDDSSLLQLASFKKLKTYTKRNRLGQPNMKPVNTLNELSSTLVYINNGNFSHSEKNGFFNTDTERYITLNMYEFDEYLKECLASVTVKIDCEDTRFAHKSIQDIKNSNNLILERDVIKRSNNHLNLLRRIDEIIKEYNKI